MDKITKAQLESALTATGSQLQRRLPAEEFEALGIAMERLARRYPNQDLALTMGEYLWDYERLSLKYSLPKVMAAIDELRIASDQKFFPRPDEIAAEIDHLAQVEYAKGSRQRMKAYMDYLDAGRRRREEFIKAMGWEEEIAAIDEARRREREAGRKRS
jgi:hypothetical protein